MLMILLYILGGYALLSLLWSVGCIAFYFLLEAKHDASGDGGLAFMFLGLLPYIWPWLIFRK